MTFCFVYIVHEYTLASVFKLKMVLMKQQSQMNQRCFPPPHAACPDVPLYVGPF